MAKSGCAKPMNPKGSKGGKSGGLPNPKGGKKGSGLK